MDNKIIFDKPFKTYAELIRIMENRHIIVEDKAFAIQALENFSYYGIVNGYKDTFLRVPQSDDFIPGTRFEELYTLHIVDTALNSILFKYILFLERALKSRMSYLVSSKYGIFTDPNDASCKNPDDYLCVTHYSNSGKRRINILKCLKCQISGINKNPIMLHYLRNKNHIPPWILTTNITYGLSIEWYNILRSCDKKAICDTFISSSLLSEEQGKEFVRKAFEITKEYRNKIAHGNRTFSFASLPQLPKEQLLALSFNTVSSHEYDSKLGQNDTMAVMLALMIMINDRHLVMNFLNDLAAVFNPYNTARFNGKTIYEVFGVPNDLYERLDALASKKFQ